MTRFKYTCSDGKTKQSYEGFQRAFALTEAFPVVLGIAVVEGESEPWFLDGENLQLAVEELGRYYRSEHGMEVRIAVYNRSTIFDAWGVEEKE